MSRVFFLVMLAVLLGAAAKAPSVYVNVHSHATQLQLTVKPIKGDKPDYGGCSGTKVGTHTILTATHCVRDIIALGVNGEIVRIKKVISDGSDNSFVIVDQTFKTYARLAPRPVVGDNIFYYGNPRLYLPKQHELLRKGYVAGFIDGDMFLDVNGWFGDSGSGVFDYAGRVTGVINQVTPEACCGFKMVVSKQFKFTAKQYKEAGVTPPAR